MPTSRAPRAHIANTAAMTTFAFAILALLQLAGAAQESRSRRLATTLNPEQQAAIVARHNSLRATRNTTHQPCSAADMETMVWDDTLATDAQTYADACVGDHAKGAGSSFGENLWMSFPGTTFSVADLVGGVQSWYDEIVDTVWAIGDTKVTSKPKNQCVEVSGDTCNVGHYFQVIWAKSKKIGCGVKACTSSFSASGTSYGSGVLLVCRYDPPASLGAGETNVLPYIFGTPCATCDGACSSSPAGLCNTAPTRCLDKLNAGTTVEIQGTTFTDCAALVAAHPAGSGTAWCTMLAAFMSMTDTCALACGACTVPSGVGSNHCSAPTTTAGDTTTTLAVSTTGTATTVAVTTSGGSGVTTSGILGATTTAGDTTTKLAVTTTGTATTVAVTTTVTTTPATVQYSGSVSVTMTGVNQSVMETAMVKALAAQFSLMESQVSVTATESRRLGPTNQRRLANNWAIDFTLTAPGSKTSAINTKVATFAGDATGLKNALSTELQSLGVDTTANTLGVSSFSAAAATTTTTTTLAVGAETSSATSAAVDHMALLMMIGTLLLAGRAN